jgi:ribosomal protein S11
MENNKKLDFLATSLCNFKFKKLQSISSVFQHKLFFLCVRITLNNIYVTVSSKFGQIIILRSGGMMKLSGLKRNTNYSLELMLLEAIKRLLKLHTSCIVIRLDVQALKKKKIIVKLLQKFNIKILCIQLQLFRAFNGVRLRKKRRI